MATCSSNGCNSCQEQLEVYKQRPIILCKFKHTVNLIPQEITNIGNESIKTKEMMFFRSSGTSNKEFENVFINTFMPLLGLGILIHNNTNEILVHKYYHKYCTIKKSIQTKIKRYNLKEWKDVLISMLENREVSLDLGLTNKMIIDLYDMYCICWQMLPIIAYINKKYNSEPNFFTNYPIFSEFIMSHGFDGHHFIPTTMNNPFKQVYKKHIRGHPDNYNSLKCIEGKKCEDDIRIYDSDMHLNIWQLSTIMLNKIKLYMQIYLHTPARTHPGFMTDLSLQPYFELFNENYRDQYARELQSFYMNKKLRFVMETFERRGKHIVRKEYTYEEIKRNRNGLSNNSKSRKMAKLGKSPNDSPKPLVRTGSSNDSPPLVRTQAITKKNNRSSSALSESALRKLIAKHVKNNSE